MELFNIKELSSELYPCIMCREDGELEDRVGELPMLSLQLVPVIVEFRLDEPSSEFGCFINLAFASGVRLIRKVPLLYGDGVLDFEEIFP